ncbi:FAD-binding protein [Pseudomonas sp. MPC6]|uniref:L-aspartate oxidase n=1 Tax=unclassified Pseudomonas TaxID=196821 RepID=UPI0011108D92|nr:FAD-binding protein [Pseudomonas sp. MPC6]QCY09554.1 FAD-binding protein [Pseudomonas sp. MPC6]
MTIETKQTDILILGSGGAGLFAALHAHKSNPDLKITVAVKGLLGKCGCTRMVQGGYNVALNDGDSVERHFMDTIHGGYWIPNQELAWKLVETAPKRVLELENEIGCFFDRVDDGSLHGKAFAGQTFDRTIHKGDLTGIEIINRLAEQVWSRPIDRLEDHRAIEIIQSEDGSRISGILMLNIRTGKPLFVQAKAVMLGTGGGPTMYRYHTPSGEKSCDGLAMALRAGLNLRDMEMVQFHPTGLLAGEGTRLTGTVLEEGLRGAGGHLLNGKGERFMHSYDERGERATRDVVSRSIYREMRKGNTTKSGGVHISMAHLGVDNVRKKFKGMVSRCKDVGADLAGGLVEVVPTAHYMMGGVEVNVDCETAMLGLYCAGEDAGGVHGANRLGGNGVANSTVYGGIAGDVMADWVLREGQFAEPDQNRIAQTLEFIDTPFRQSQGDLTDLRYRLLDKMWDDAGIIRNEVGLVRAYDDVLAIREELMGLGIPDHGKAYNQTWHDWLNLHSQISVSLSIIKSAQLRKNSRGAHFRDDFPEKGDLDTSTYVRVRQDGDAITVTEIPVEFTRVKPGQTLIPEENDNKIGVAS